MGVGFLLPALVARPAASLEVARFKELAEEQYPLLRIGSLFDVKQPSL